MFEERRVKAGEKAFVYGWVGFMLQTSVRHVGDSKHTCTRHVGDSKDTCTRHVGDSRRFCRVFFFLGALKFSVLNVSDP